MSILTEPVPVYATMVTGATGLVVGALLARQVARDKIAMARRLHTLAVRYEAEADKAYAKTRALTEPTQSVPVIELIPPSRSQRMHLAVTAAIERLTARDEQLPDWADGEMTRAFARADQETVPATPYVGPGVSRGRLRAEGSHAELPARLRTWGPRLVHGLDGPVRMPERFGLIQLPAQRRATPLVMARLREDSTRQFRVKKAGS
jgi:hypothetical protein